MTGAEVARRPVGALAVSPTQVDWTPDQRAALDSLGIDHTASEGDLRVFLSYAQRTGLDPFARQIYLIGRNSKEMIDGQWRWRKRYSIQVGIDGFRVIAARTGKYRGRRPTVWCGPDGQWRDVWLSAEPPAAARVEVLHADWLEPLQAVAIFDEYAPRNTDGALSGLWAKMPALMIAKVAEALAMRQAFPHDLGGIYVDAEMDQGPRQTAGMEMVPRTPAAVLADVHAATTRDELAALWNETGNAGTIDQDATDPDTGMVATLREHIIDRGRVLAVAETPAAGEPQGGPDAHGSGTVGSDPAAGSDDPADAPTVIDVPLPQAGDGEDDAGEFGTPASSDPWSEQSRATP